MNQDLLIRSITNLSVAITSAFTLVLSAGRLGLVDGIVGFILLLLLFTYSGHGDPAQTRIEHLVSSALLALCTLLILGWLVFPLSQRLFPSPPSYTIVGTIALAAQEIGVFIFWLIATLIWTRIHPQQRWPKLFQPAGH
jgi:Kef-type K+ transport system membrane component KefB